MLDIKAEELTIDVALQGRHPLYSTLRAWISLLLQDLGEESRDASMDQSRQ